MALVFQRVTRGSISAQTKFGSVILDYLQRDYGGEWRDMNYPVRLTSNIAQTTACLKLDGDSTSNLRTIQQIQLAKEYK